jgi:hypothetical protein
MELHTPHELLIFLVDLSNDPAHSWKLSSGEQVIREAIDRGLMEWEQQQLDAFARLLFALRDDGSITFTDYAGQHRNGDSEWVGYNDAAQAARIAVASTGRMAVASSRRASPSASSRWEASPTSARCPCWSRKWSARSRKLLHPRRQNWWRATDCVASPTRRPRWVRVRRVSYWRLCSKTLHKKRPALIPVLDNQAILGAYMNPYWSEKRSLADTIKAVPRIKGASRLDHRGPHPTGKRRDLARPSGGRARPLAHRTLRHGLVDALSAWRAVVPEPT